MKIFSCALLTLACVASVFAIGCGPVGSSTIGRVGIIDLDAVAKTLGRDVEMSGELKEAEQSLNSQLAKVQVQLQGQLNEQQQALGDSPSEEETKGLQLLQQQANAKLVRVRNQAQTALNQRKGELIHKFREEASAHAKAVAAEQGLSIVITKVDNFVLIFDQAVDITSAVADRMKSSPASEAVSARATKPAAEESTAVEETPPARVASTAKSSSRLARRR